MTARRASNGDLIVSKSFAALIPIVLLILGLSVGWGVAWGTVCGDVGELQQTRDDYVRKEVFNETLKRIDTSLANIDTRLGRIEDKR